MKVQVTKERIVITEHTPICAGEFGVNSCQFTLPACFAGLSVVASFANIPVPVMDGVCGIPALPKGNATLGVYAYSEQDDSVTLMYSPKPTVFFVEEGSYSESVACEEVPVPSVYDAYLNLIREARNEIAGMVSGREAAFRVDAAHLPEGSSSNAGKIYQYIDKNPLERPQATPDTPGGWARPACTLQPGQFFRIASSQTNTYSLDADVNAQTTGKRYVKPVPFVGIYSEVTLPADYSDAATYYSLNTQVHYYMEPILTDAISTALSASSTDNEVSTAKAVWDAIQEALTSVAGELDTVQALIGGTE